MNVRFASALSLLLLALASTPGAAAPEPTPPLHVSDSTGTLSSEELAALEGRLRDFEQRRLGRIVVLMLPTTGIEPLGHYALRMSSASPDRRANDDLALLIIAKNDRRLHIHIGTKLRRAIPEAMAKRIVDRVLAQRFEADEFYCGIRDGTETMIKLIEGGRLPTRPSFPVCPHPEAPGARLRLALSPS